MSNRAGSTREFGTSYFGVRDPEGAKRDLERFADAGLNAVLHTFSERDRRYYQGTMEQIIAESHRRDLTVYVNPWGVGGVFGGEALTEFPARYPDARQQLSNGRRLPAACFNAPEFRDFVGQWIESAADTGADFLFWDEPHWLTVSHRDQPGLEDAWTCRCSHCRRRFEETRGTDMPEKLTDPVRSFRSESIRAFLRMAVDRTVEAGLQNAVCFAPDTAPVQGKDELEGFAEIDGLDVLAVTPFWDFHDKNPQSFVGAWAKRITQLTRGNSLRTQLWIQGFDIGGKKEDLEAVRTAVRTALSHKPDSLFIWGWDGCRVMSSIASDKPEDVWNVFRSGIRGEFI